ncbi:MAG: lipoyl(octanoyl) transferase LipB [Candidatus Marinimicrobia bacterium]|nr:lipoyl(octanoyl) transferase LipB [Candidatus Neomarinimicrobiota bacterium]MDD5582816.1 lipoyl(octanoyl) transferase LipB [Candidatus Neomarinimicrobiota bacterium]
MKTLILWTPGRVDYQKAWKEQQRLHALRKQDKIPDVLILLEHPHVYTLGQHGDKTNILYQEVVLKNKGISVYATDRGGDVTYHGPGQLVGYPLFHYKYLGFSTRRFVHSLEEVIIQTLKKFSLHAERDPQYPGVWMDKNKICSIGLRVIEGVSMHGFALNVHPDLDFFKGIIACGIKDRGVTSMAKECEKQNLPLPDEKSLISELTTLFLKIYGFETFQSVSDSTLFSDGIA